MSDAKREVQKGTLESAVAAAGAVALATGGVGAAAIAAAVAAAPSLVSLAVDGLRMRTQRRVTTWARHLLEGVDDPIAFTETVRQAIEDGDARATDAVLGAAKAAADAVDDAAVPSIGLLARLHLQQGIPARARYRDLLLLLQVVEARDIADLTKVALFFAARAAQRDDDPIRTRLITDGSDDNRTWKWIIRGSDSVTLLTEDGAQRVFELLKTHRLGDDYHSSVTPDESGPRILMISRETARVLALILPAETTDEHPEGSDGVRRP